MKIFFKDFFKDIFQLFPNIIYDIYIIFQIRTKLSNKYIYKGYNIDN